MAKLVTLVGTMVVTGSLLSTGVAHATPILEFPTPQTDIQVVCGAGAPDCTVGWSFTTTQALDVTALDALAPNRAAGIQGSANPTGEQVRLYTGTGTVLASATVSSTDATEGSPFVFDTVPISVVALQAATTYYIAMDLGGEVNGVLVQGAAIFHVNGVTTSPSITYGGGVSVFGLGGTPITDGLGVPGDAYFGPDFDAAPIASSVPEPTSMLLLGTGLIGVGARRWRTRRQRR